MKIHLSVEEKDTNQITENLINQKLQFFKNSRSTENQKNSQKTFFPWAYTFIQEVKKMAKTTNLKPVIDHFLRFPLKNFCLVI